MKRIIAILMLCCLFGSALAETALDAATAEPAATPTPLESSANGFLDSLGQTWDAFLGLAGEAGSAAGEWVNGALDEVNAFIDENLPELKQWLDDAGKYITEELSPEVREAWQVICESAAEIGEHTKEEVQRAYEEIRQKLEESDADQTVVEAVDGLAEAAGADVDAAD